MQLEVFLAGASPAKSNMNNLIIRQITKQYTNRARKMIMLRFGKRLNKQGRSERASRAADARWQRDHAGKAAESIRQDLPDPLFEMMFKNNLTGRTHDIRFHYLNGKSLRVTDNGKDWLVCGFSKALAEIRKRCPRIQFYE